MRTRRSICPSLIFFPSYAGFSAEILKLIGVSEEKNERGGDSEIGKLWYLCERPFLELSGTKFDHKCWACRVNFFCSSTQRGSKAIKQY